MRRIVWSVEALAEFDSIVTYIAADNPDAANHVADRIEATVSALSFMSTGRRGRVAGTYEKVVTDLPYIIAYALGTIRPATQTLTILRIVHGARNWQEGQWPES